METTAPIAYENHVPDIYKQWETVEGLIAASGFDAKLKHLVKLRASQMNGCGFCVKLHTREARKDGETDARLDRLIVWRHVSDFTQAERAAFAWTEALTHLKPEADFGALQAGLLEHFSEKEISVLTSIVTMINLWNRFAVSRH